MKLVVAFLGFALCFSLESEATAQQFLPGALGKECEVERVLLETWRARSVVYIVGYKGTDGFMMVHTNAWRRVSHDLKSRLALAAFCPIGSKFGRGRLDIDGRLGPSFGAIIDGKWHQRDDMKR